MRRTAFYFAVALAATMMTPRATRAQTQDDRSGVRRAVQDYVEGFYEGDTAKLVRSVRPEVYKYGFWRQRDSASYVGEQMKYPEFLAYARRVKQNNRPTPATAPKKIELYDVQNMTASAKLTAFWGTDYLLLGKYDGRWMISHVMWQSPPKSPPKSNP
jgi:hypothetical protein